MERETVSKIRSSDALKNVFIADGLLLGKVIPKVFFINVRDRVMRRKKYGHTFSEMPKNVVSNFRLFLFGV